MSRLRSVATASPALEIQRRAFLDSLRVRGYSLSSQSNYSTALASFFGFLAAHGVHDARAVDRRTVREYQTWLMACGLAIRTVHLKLQGLRRFFEHLEKTDCILLNPCEGLRLPKLGERLPRTVLTHEEARTILDTVNPEKPAGLRDRALLEMFYSTGLRREEMQRLEVGDVDVLNGIVRVHRGKGGKARVVPMGERACRALQDYLIHERAAWNRGRVERALWLSSHQPHQLLKKEALGALVRRHGKRAGLARRVTPHVWRHTCATHLLRGGSNIVHVQRLLGHRSLETTQIYTRVALPEVQATFRQAHPRALVA